MGVIVGVNVFVGTLVLVGLRVIVGVGVIDGGTFLVAVLDKGTEISATFVESAGVGSGRIFSKRIIPKTTRTSTTEIKINTFLVVIGITLGGGESGSG